MRVILPSNCTFWSYLLIFSERCNIPRNLDRAASTQNALEVSVNLNPEPHLVHLGEWATRMREFFNTYK